MVVPSIANIDKARKFLADATHQLKMVEAGLLQKRNPQVAFNGLLETITNVTLSLFGGEATNLPLSVADIKSMTVDGEIRLITRIGFDELACISEDGTIDGLNDWLDSVVGTGCVPSDISYRPIAVDHQNEAVFFEVNFVPDFTDDSEE